MKARKPKRTIASSKFRSNVGYSPTPVTPAAPAGGGTNAAAMRATFAFLPYNQDEVNKREYADKAKWRAENPTAPESEYPGMSDLWGRNLYPDTAGAKCSAKPGCIWQYWKTPPECRDVRGVLC